MEEKIGKKFGLRQGIGLSFGVVVGVGIYFKTPELLGITQNNPLVGLIAWLIGAIFVISWALTVSEMAGTITETGGILTYIRATAGELPTFMMGWLAILLGGALIAILTSVASIFISLVFGIEGTLSLVITILLVVLLYGINIFAPRFGGSAGWVLTIIKVIPLLAIIIGGLFFTGDGHLSEALGAPIKLEGTSFFQALIAALVPITFAFSGWDYVATVSGEVKDPKKTVPKAIIISVLAAAVVYLLFYLACINIMPIEDVAGSIPFGITQNLFGEVGGKVIMVCIIVSAISAANGVTIGAMRVPYSLGIKNLCIAPAFFSKVNEKLQVPVRSSILMFVLTLVHVFLINSGNDFSGIGVVFNLLFWGIVYVGVVIMKKKGKLDSDSYHTPFFPLVPIFAIVTTLVMTIGLFFIDATTTRNTLIAAAVIVISIPLYYLLKKKAVKKNDELSITK